MELSLRTGNTERPLFEFYVSQSKKIKEKIVSIGFGRYSLIFTNQAWGWLIEKTPMNKRFVREGEKGRYKLYGLCFIRFQMIWYKDTI